MTTFNTKTNTNANSVKGTPRVTNLHLVSLPNRPSLMGFANVIYEGKIFASSIAVRQTREGDAYLRFPANKRVRNGQDVLDNNGRPIYDDIFGPADKETREHMQKMIFDAVQDAMDGKPAPEKVKGEEKVTVHLGKDDSNGFVAMVSGVFEGKFFLTNISVNQPENGDAFLGSPARRRMRDGQPVLDENGRQIYDDYFGPGSKADKDALENMVFAAVQAELDKQQQ